MMGKCVGVTLGPMCVLESDGSYVFCGAGATCQMNAPCLPAAADGAACSDMNGPACVWPAFCSTVDNHCHLFQANRGCGGGSAAVRPHERRPGPLPGSAGVLGQWPFLPRGPHEKF